VVLIALFQKSELAVNVRSSPRPTVMCSPVTNPTFANIRVQAGFGLAGADYKKDEFPARIYGELLDLKIVLEKRARRWPVHKVNTQFGTEPTI
jgi:hypothetical protein